MPRSKIYFARDLTALNHEDHSAWFTSSLTELGEEAFAAAMLEASQGDPFDASTPESAVADLRELQDAALEAFNPDRWVVISDNAGMIGVVLPQPYPHDCSQGTLFYLGVVPGRRGCGFGKHLHHYGLQQLAQVRVEKYRGSTDTENAAMRAVFLANGCAPEMAHPGQ